MLPKWRRGSYTGSPFFELLFDLLVAMWLHELVGIRVHRGCWADMPLTLPSNKWA